MQITQQIFQDTLDAIRIQYSNQNDPCTFVFTLPDKHYSGVSYMFSYHVSEETNTVEGRCIPCGSSIQPNFFDQALLLCDLWNRDPDNPRVRLDTENQNLVFEQCWEMGPEGDAGWWKIRLFLDFFYRVRQCVYRAIYENIYNPF